VHGDVPEADAVVTAVSMADVPVDVIFCFTDGLHAIAITTPHRTAVVHL
jgi:hypothetical protein